jgi:hypothetical protein
VKLGAAILGLTGLVLPAQQRESPQRLVLFEEEVKVPRAQWRALTVTLKQRPAYLEVRHEVLNGGPKIRVLVMTRGDADRLLRGQSHRVLAGTEEGGKGSLRYLATRPGDYMVVVDNRSTARGQAVVQLKVGLAYDPEYVSFAPRTLPSSRRRVVVLISLLGFGVAAGWSGWKLRKAMAAERGTSAQSA